MRGCNRHGQTLVEFSFVFPVFCFVVWMLVQFCVFSFNQIQIQRMVQVGVDQLTMESYRATRPYTWFERLMGTGQWPILHQRLVVLPEQRSFNGILVHQAPSYLVRSKIEGSLWPGHFMGRFVWPVDHIAFAEVLKEPFIDRRTE